jgi:hypothetical protein
MINPRRENRKKERLAKALAKDDAKMGFTPTQSEPATVFPDVYNAPEITGNETPQGGVTVIDTTNPSTPEVAKNIGQELYDRMTATSGATLSDFGIALEKAEELKKETEAIRNEVSIAQDTYNPEGKAVNDVFREHPWKASYQSTATTQDVDKQVAEQSIDEFSELKRLAPALAVEQLGVQDYFPDAGRNIGVGTFTGSRIGSQTIYSGAGALLPMGLYDARKRKLAEKAKEKQAALEKLLTVMDTAPQMQEAFSKTVLDHAYKYIDKYGGDATQVLKDKDFVYGAQRLKDLAREITYFDGYADKVFTSLKDGKWVPKDVKDRVYRIKAGLVDDIDGIMSGKSKISKDINYLKTFENLSTRLDDKVKDGIFDPSKMSKMPINLKSNLTYNDVITDANGKKIDYNQFIQKVQEGSIDNDTYLTGVKTFFDTSNVESIIDNLIATNDFDANNRQAGIDYMIAQIPTQVVFDYKTVGNQVFERENMKNDNYWKQKEFDLKVNQMKSPYTVANELMNMAGPDGKTLTQKFAEIGNSKLSDSEKRKKMFDAARAQGLDPVWDDHTGTVLFRQPASDYESSHAWPTSPEKTLINIYKIDKNGNKIPSRVTPETIAKMSGEEGYFLQGGQSLNGDVVSNMNEGLKGELLIQPSYIDKGIAHKMGDGTFNYVTAKNAHKANDGKTTNVARTVGNLLFRDAEGNLINILNGAYDETDISDETSRAPLDSRTGEAATKQINRQNGEPIKEVSSSSTSGGGGLNR